MTGVYILVISVAASILVGSLVITRGLRDKTTIIFALLTVSLLTLCIMNSLAVMLKDNQIIYVRGVMASTTVAMYLIYVLIMELKERRPKIAYFKSKLFYATALMFIVDFTDLLFLGVIPGEPPKPIPNFGIIFFFGLYIATLIMGIRQLRKDMARAATVSERRRYSLLIAGIIPIIFFAPLTSFVMPNYLGISQFVVATPLYVFIFVSLVGYAIVRHGLFDIRRAAVRTVTYALSLFSLSVIYYAAAFIVSITFFQGQNTTQVSLSPVNILLAIGLSFIFQPIKHFFDRVTNNIFYRDNYKSEDFFANLSNLLTSTTDLRGLLVSASDEIASTFKSEQVLFFLQYENATHHHISAGTSGHASIPLSDIKLLDRLAFSTKESIFVTDLMPYDNNVRRMLVSHRIALVMPLRQGDKISGYVLLGDHRTSNYTKRDLNVLSATSNELVIAIQNALSLHEVKELNATLQQRIDVATKELRSSNAQLKHLDEVKDEFMSMASHQLRTPLTSIKGYLSMVLDGDVGKITPQQEKVLAEAFNSSERMVHLIADFLNVSRLQTGKFVIEKSVIDFNALVEQEISDLQVMAKSRSLELVLKLPKTKLLINADTAKLREVITNFVDNAIYYSRLGTKIAIRVKQDGGSLLFTVTDTGIGVPKAEQAKVFGKFFRATNARKQRPDGTGVGLYLARKVITAHGGKEIFESVEGKGSIFGFRMPLAALPNSADDTNNNDDNRNTNANGN